MFLPGLDIKFLNLSAAQWMSLKPLKAGSRHTKESSSFYSEKTRRFHPRVLSCPGNSVLPPHTYTHYLKQEHLTAPQPLTPFIPRPSPLCSILGLYGVAWLHAGMRVCISIEWDVHTSFIHVWASQLNSSLFLCDAQPGEKPQAIFQTLLPMYMILSYLWCNTNAVQINPVRPLNMGCLCYFSKGNYYDVHECVESFQCKYGGY